MTDRRTARDREPAESRLVEAIRRGNRSAFARLIELYKDRLVNYLTRMTRDRDRAEDLAQETFVRFYERSRSYRHQGQLAAYLYRIAHNLLVTEERRKGRWRSLSERFLRPESAPQQRPDQIAHLLREEIQGHLERALADLPLHQRSAILLFEVEGCSYQEIAAILGCSEGTIKSRIHRGRQRLRAALTPYWTSGAAAATPEEAESAPGATAGGELS